MAQEKINTFGKIGRLISKRKFALIAVWILLLAIIIPIVLTASGYESMTLTSTTNTNSESGIATNIINKQFQASVANDTLLLIVSTNNASSLQTQQLIDELVTKINSDPSITGVENVTTIYSVLTSTLNQTNQGVYLVYDNGNLTYNLLYSVPAIYSQVWYAAYNTALQDNLVPALSQTDQGVYSTISNANLTCSLLYGPAAMYLQYWGANYAATGNVTQANAYADQATAATLQQVDPADYATYTSSVLSIFNNAWQNSFSTNPTLDPTDRAVAASNATTQTYIASLSSNATEQGFVAAATNALTFQSYLTNTQAQDNTALTSFAIQMVAAQGNISTQFVTAAYNCGVCPTTSELTSLANQVIWSPTGYGMSSLIPTFNGVAYNQTQTILKNAAESSYNQYTSHLLNYFNASWSSLVPSSASSSSWINSTAAEAANVANQEFVANYFSGNAAFADKVASTFTLQDFLSGNTTYTNGKLEDFAVNYVANESGLSENLVKAIYDLGGNASKTALQTLASNIVYDPDAYQVGDALNSAISSFVSPSQNVTLVDVSLNQTNVNNVPALRTLISNFLTANHDGISSIKVTGQDAISYDFRESTNKDLDLILPVTLILLIGATALFFRSIITPLVTLGTIGVGLGVSLVFPYLVGTYINQVDYTIVTVLLTVLIGVGTDYSIFIIARHREERINGLPVTEAIKKSITWAGESIVTSGTTVIIAFLALSATSMVFLQTMGIIIGLGVIVTLLAALTFAPAITAILGDRIFWPNTGERFQKYAQSIREKNQRRGGYFARSGALSVKHSKAIILLAIVVTVPALFVYATTVQSYNFLGSASPSLESVSGYNTLTDAFGSGRMLPSYVVVTFSQPILYGNGSFNTGELSTLNQISSYVADHVGIQKVTGPTMPYGAAVDYQTITNASDPINYSGMLSDIGADNKSALLTVEFSGDPYSTNAMNYAQNIRSTLHSDYSNSADVTGIYVGGTTGSILDVKNTFSQELNQILPTVTICVALVLFFVLGSLFLPIFAVLSVFMSIFWTLAVTILVFHAAFNYGLLFVTPLILIVLLLGLGMDYNIFILTRVREEAAKGQKLNDAIVHAIQQTGGIITAAAIILAGSLGSLMLSSNLMLKELGFAFGFSILVDALVVRTYLVPAVMSLMGKWNWYNPIKRLRRVKDQE